MSNVISYMTNAVAIAARVLNAGGIDRGEFDPQEFMSMCRGVVEFAHQHNTLDAKIQRLEARQQEHLRLINNLSQSTPLDDEVSNALAQRGVLLAEIGTLKSERIALHRAWFGTMGVLTPEILTVERERFAATSIALEESAAQHAELKAKIVAVAQADNAYNDAADRADVAEDAAKRALSELYTFVAEPDGDDDAQE